MVAALKYIFLEAVAALCRYGLSSLEAYVSQGVETFETDEERLDMAHVGKAVGDNNKEGLDALMALLGNRYGEHLIEDASDWLVSMRRRGFNDTQIIQHVKDAHQNLLDEGLAIPEDDLDWLLSECKPGGLLSSLTLDFTAGPSPEVY